MAISLTHTTAADATFSTDGAAAWDEAHTLTMATARMLGRTTASAGAVEEITVGTGLSLSAGDLSCTVTATAAAGSDTQIQFNDGGTAFGGDAGLTYNKTTDTLTLASGGQLAFSTDLFATRKAAANLQLGAADAAAPVAQTLSVQSVVAGTSNTAGTDFSIYGSKSTGSAAGGSIKFYTSPAGGAGTAQNAGVLALTIASNGAATFQGSVNSQYDFRTSNTYLGVYNGVAYCSLTSNGELGWTNSTSDPNTTRDVILYRDAANTLALRNGTNAQAFNVYNTYTSSTSYERAMLKWDSNYFYFGTEKGSGGGTGRDVIFQSASNFYFDPISIGDIYFRTATAPGWRYGGAAKTLFPDVSLATNMTTGFINIPGAAGAPSGTPAETTGFPLYWDSTNNKLYVYDGGWLSTAALT